MEQGRRVDIGVAVNLSVAEKARSFEARDQTQHVRLLAKFQVILKSDKIVRIGPQIFLPQLHRRVWNSVGTRIFESHWLHRAEAQGIASAARDLFDRQAAFEVV